MNDTPAGAPCVQAVRELTPATLGMLDALVVASGWNQVASDWSLFHSLGTIYEVRDASAQVVASGAVLPMDRTRPTPPDQRLAPGVSWISMILVTPTARGRGLGRAVFDRCVQHVTDDGRIAMLDATPQGEPLYRQFGFEALWRLTRWRREALGVTVRELPRAGQEITQLLALDSAALGFSRQALLQELVNRPDSRCLRSGSGFAVVRTGRVAHHVGPLVATDEHEAIGLLRQVAAGVEGPLLADVPDDKILLRQALLEAGFAPQRGFARMALSTGGEAVPRGRASLLHAIAGPEFG